jgi:replicative DNA helicase
MMESQTRPDGNVPLALEAENAIASVAVNHPDLFLKHVAEKQFKLTDIFNPLCKAVCEIALELAAKGSSCDVRLVYEKVKEQIQETTFYQISEIYQHAPIASALPEFIEIVRAKAKRRGLMQVLIKTKKGIDDSQISTAQLLNDIAIQVESLSSELSPPLASDTKNLLIDAIRRYEVGEDSTSRISTGFTKLDNLSPIRYGDYVIIGGETKSGKTMLALNIIAHLLKCS